MGYYKEKQIDEFSRGYHSINKNVCYRCVGDKYLSNIIKNKKQGYSSEIKICKCDYCGKRIKTISMDVVMTIIMDTINYYFEMADDYPRLEAYDSYDIGDWLMYNTGCEAIIPDIRESLIYSYVNVEKIWGDCDIDEFKVTWENYVEMIMSTKIDSYQIAVLCSKNVILEEYEKIAECLEYFSTIIFKHQIQKYMKKELPIYRAVKYDDSRTNVSFLGTAPPSHAKNNRLSEKGDMVFYGSGDQDTAILELNTADCDQAVSKFYLNKRIRIVRLTKIDSSKYPSIFSSKDRDKLKEYKILNMLFENVSKSNDVNEDNYRPTQVLSYYLRLNHNISGISYNSSKNTSGVCYCLFIPNHMCIDKNEKVSKDKPQLIFDSFIKIKGKESDING